MAASRNDVLFLVCTTIAVSMVLAIVFLMNAYFSVVNVEWGLTLDKKEDAIQWSLCCAAIATGALILMYVVFSKQQADAAQRQLGILLTPTVRFVPKSMKIGRDHRFSWYTEDGNYIILDYEIENLSENTGEYDLTVTPYLIPTEKFRDDLNYRNAVTGPVSEMYVQIAEARKSNVSPRRTIYPVQPTKGSFYIRLTPFTEYLQAYLIANHERFADPKYRAEEDNIEERLFNYFEAKMRESKDGIHGSDPIWFKFLLRVYPYGQQRENPVFTFEQIYNLRSRLEGYEYFIFDLIPVFPQ